MCCLRSAGRRLIHLIALALNLNEDFFEKVGALDAPMPFLRLLHYPGMETQFGFFVFAHLYSLRLIILRYFLFLFFFSFVFENL